MIVGKRYSPLRRDVYVERERVRRDRDVSRKVARLKKLSVVVSRRKGWG